MLLLIKNPDHEIRLDSTTQPPPIRPDFFLCELTGLLLPVSPPGLPEGHQGPEVGAQHRPAEGGSRVDAHQAADEGVLAALQQRHDVRPHVVRVLLPEVLHVGTGDTSMLASSAASSRT